ncbi:MAG: Xenobiotic-transporting ATPase [Candidatus Falkowbacteria bacterium GW2011_GWC2_38_22]|uniref:Xenobiotic-transporting ATPase n=1 Tax=Candidatus Falkowbacteria bacterium GW2011_GWE1_38_31 TaxID=1618638 RepID=A0A0G0JTG5_9BACT|nr:MAG: Xenobiotic-transporting ATPase [Candidatus Falkowbacteria bacterium GW2011_GWF2_38_1205]KKQ61920.1 MAG: Xenobiotic-transporting ATPase [Candidatus Falkowbacteria bacterium GW2011_GWC2_38_22]KKQ63918.1 MAG: Xenobiotic-transporting ATPase [Candidatus Falkowbacteria bacterium GW2011_GWF1_38_22]KKQ66175.1 MAG: Xenobiotic-transporting ATPase [Candidatus Falkowbacteria bacterium GW2011_GWE2_38_254]KKQ70778.1 MAG: Xenobiotic-transporting ATPase [Candidatus Falkowbacteria bacterium GW2011_GWE1_
MFKLLKFLKPYYLQLIALVFLVFGTVAATMQLPEYMAKIINDGIINSDTGLIAKNGFLMFLIAFGGAISTIGVGFVAARIATAFSRDVRNKVFSRVESFSLVEFNKFSTASLITRSTNDIQQIQMVMALLLRMVLQAPVAGIWAIYKAYHLASSLSWTIALAVAVLLGVIFVMFMVAVPKFKILQKLVDRLNLVARENLTGLRVIRAFNGEKTEQAKFEKANVDLTAANLFVNRLMVVMQPAMMLILNLTSVLIVWVGARYINTGGLDIGNMIAFMQYAMQVIMSFLMISMVFIMLPRAAVSAVRVNDVIETEPLIKDPVEPVVANDLRGGVVEFKDVTFCYDGADTPVIRNISFKTCPGETTAIIGSTGSGKSTLINLISRFYDINSGQILLNGVDVRDYRLEDLYAKIGYVPQKAVLFSGTVESNLKFGAPDASDVEIKKSSQVSQAEEFIEKLEGKFNAPIAQGGANISGGQKQKLSIARAIVKNPEIYIFDDSFSALDFKTDSMLRNALKLETEKKTVLVVAQRISTIMSAEKIIVLNEGRIVGEGTHSELLKNCDVYREIAYSQLSEAELEHYQVGVERKSV